jgi:hypothetical protein
MLRRQKHSKNEVVAPKEEEEVVHKHDTFIILIRIYKLVTYY